LYAFIINVDKVKNSLQQLKKRKIKFCNNCYKICNIKVIKLLSGFTPMHPLMKQKGEIMKNAILLLSMLLCAANVCATEYKETWDTSNNYWLYWDEDGELQPGGWYLHDLPMHHSMTGGQSSGPGSLNAGYVYCDLSEAGVWQPGVEDMYWPAYLVDAQNKPAGAAGSLANHIGSVYTNGFGSLNLMSATMHFFIGEYIDQGGTGVWTWFMLKNPITIGLSKWQKSYFFISSDVNDWIEVDGGAGIDLATMLSAPQQIGFGLANAQGDLTGTLGFDTFSVSPIPEPSAMLLSLLGISWLFRQMKRR